MEARRMIPLRTHQIWLGSELPERFGAWRFDMHEKNPLLKHDLWTDDRLPELGLSVGRLKDEFGSWAAVSNFVRLIVLQKFGGLYCDSDFQHLKSLDYFFCEGFDGVTAAAAMQDGGRICNAWMMAEPNHPWINWQLAHIGEYDRRDGASGVYLATDAPRDGLTIIPSHLVYPYLYDAQPENRVAHPDSILVHAWEGSWTK